MIVIGAAPRISRGAFVRILEERNAPIGSRAGDVYDYCLERRIDPLFVLAIAYVESHFETHPQAMTLKYQLNNPGSRRSAVIAPRPIVLTEKGPFVRYQSSYEGWCDIAYSLTAPSFVYVKEGRRDIRDIVERWAPSSENDTQAYIDTVVAFMNRYADLGGRVYLDSKLLAGVPFRADFVPETNPNYSGLSMDAKWITVHETANTNPGANAEMHRRFVHAGGGQENVSFHFVVDDKEVIQLLPLNVVAWHAGDGRNGPGNRTSLAIETCVNADGNWQKTLENLRKLLVALCRQFGFGVGQIVQHNKWSGKNCPTRLRQGGWFELLKAVEADLKETKVRYFEETNCSVGHGFLEFFDTYGGVRVFGYPITNELDEVCEDGKTRTVQYFEKAVFEFHPENPPEWRVLLRRLGADALRRKEAEERDRKRLSDVQGLIQRLMEILDDLKREAA